jgi:hypothetical protein
MKCEDVEIMMPEFLQGTLAPGELLGFQAHTAHCQTCRQILTESQQLWQQLGRWDIAEPNDRMRDNFYGMLSSYQAGMQAGSGKKRGGVRLEGRLGRWIPGGAGMKWLLIAAVFGLGLWLGHAPVGREREALQSVRSDYENLAQRASLSLMNHQSPSERLSGVSWSTRLRDPDERVLDALLYILDNDSNVNVRLSAIEALYAHRDNEKVRAGLVRALGHAVSPMVQAALIDSLVAMGANQAASSLENLLNTDDLNPVVREKARQGLRSMH